MASLVPLPKFYATDNNGRPVSGGKLFTYEAGTITKLDTYTTSSGGVANTNPVVMDSAGRANVWLNDTDLYKLVFSPADDTDPPANPFWTADNVGGVATRAQLAESSGSGLVGFSQSVDYPAGTVGAKLTQNVSVKDAPFNAKGDGATDDTEAIQAAFTYASENGVTLFFPRGVYLVDDNLFLHSDASVIGEDKATTIVRLTAVPTRFYWVIIGTNAYGGTSMPFTGRMSDITFDVPADLPSSIQTALHFGGIDGANIDRVQVNSNGKVTNKAFGGIPNNDFIVGIGTRRRSWFVDCVVGGSASTDGESFGFEVADDLVFRNCLVLGESGDDFGIHKCSGILIDGCNVSAYNARYYIGDCSNVQIVNSKLDYVAATEGMGIMVTSESVAVPGISTDIIISNNIIKYGAGATTSNYGIRIGAGRNVIVANNRLEKANSVSVANIFVENQTLAGWVDPTGIDPNDNPQCHQVSIIGNIADGLISVTGGDNIVLDGNTALSFNVEGPAVIQRFDNNIYTSSTLADNRFSSTAGNRIAAKCICKFIVTNTGASYVNGYEYPSAVGATSHVLQRDVAVTHLVVSSTTPVASGFYQIFLTLSGVQTGDGKSYSAAVPAEVNYIASAGTKNYLFARGDQLGVQAKTNNGLPTPNDVIVEVWGLEL